MKAFILIPGPEPFDGVRIRGRLTTDHPASSYGMPVFVADTGEVFGPADIPGDGYIYIDNERPSEVYSDEWLAYRAAQEDAASDVSLGIPWDRKAHKEPAIKYTASFRSLALSAMDAGYRLFGYDQEE